MDLRHNLGQRSRYTCLCFEDLIRSVCDCRKNRLPSSVRETDERVVRSRSRIPTCASSRATARLMPGWETFKDLAAAAKPPDLTTAARALTPFRRRSSKLMYLCYAVISEMPRRLVPNQSVRVR